jgi:hypothetical protein
MTPEHDDMAELINRVGYYNGTSDAVHSTLDRAVKAFHRSAEHHDSNNFREAHNQLQIAAEHLGTAASLGVAEGRDARYGQSMTPKDIAEGIVNSYKYAYLS